MNEQNKHRHPLKCPECSDFTFLVIKYVRFEQDNKGVDYNVPFFECKKCNYSKPLKPLREWKKMAEDDRKKLGDGEFVRMLFPYEGKRFQQYDHLDFTYDSTDYYLIPGLSGNDGSLTPVFFDRDLLLFYNSHPDYSVKLYSFSSGNIYYKGEALFNWGFGINRSGKIFKWIGDLNDDFEDEKMKSHLKRFQASNIESDHDIVSKFYFSQIPFSEGDMFQKSDNEYRLFKVKNNFDENVNKKYGFKLFKLDIKNLTGYYKHPILEEKDQIFSAYLSLNKYIIENIEQGLLRNFLVQNGLSEKGLKELGSLKLMESFITNILKIPDANSIISPLYVLNDLRQLHSHMSDTSFDKRYESCKQRLGCKK